MRKPKMILFDYGQTLVNEKKFDGIAVPNHMFTAFLYQSMGIELPLTPQQIDRTFWDVASPGVPTEGILDFLAFLKEQSIRTGVISNISYCGEIVEERINNLLPEHNFEFIIATSEYMFRKPNKKIFELALEKAELQSEDVWYIGDNYQCDVIGARNAGIFPVWYIGATANPQGEDNGLTILHWDQLKKAIAELSE